MVQSHIRIAIVGGGLAGTVLMNSLIKHSHLDVHLYEANEDFKERGASVGLADNAQRALKLIGLGETVKRARGVKVASFRVVMGEGPDAGKKVMDMENDLKTVHRAALLKELLASIPKERMHLGKRLSSIQRNQINFVDGTSVTADLLIGADGIHSSVRKYMLGEGHPAIDPVFAGFWDCRTVIPFEEALDKIGPHRIDKQNPRQHLYCGDKSMLFHDTIDDGKSICIVGGGPTPPDWDKQQWKQSVSRDWLNEVFKGWGDFGQSMLDCLCGEQTSVSTFVQWASAETPTLYNGPLCVIGDAAHATTPWQGNGLGQAIEDSLVLGTLLGRCTSPTSLPSALKSYDKTMRPRGQRVIESSQATGMIYVGANGLEAKKLARDLERRWEFIHHWDTEGALGDAVVEFEEDLRAKT